MKVFATLLTSVLLLAGHHASAQGRCEAAIDQKLAALGVSKPSVTDITIQRESTTEGALQGYFAWLRLDGCRGHLVMDLTTYCLVSQVYTRGDCRVPGVKAY